MITNVNLREQVTLGHGVLCCYFFVVCAGDMYLVLYVTMLLLVVQDDTRLV